MRRLILLVAIIIGAAACSSAEPDAGSVATTSSVAASTEPAAESAPTTSSTTRPALPGVAALTSGRGDDGSLEVGVWFGVDPFGAGDARIRIGTDADDSYPGVGDPVPHIDAWAELSPTGVELNDGGAVVVSGGQAEVSEWVSWTGPGRSMYVFFLQSVPVRAGTVWVVTEVDGVSVVDGVAGAPLGDSCSYQSAGIDLGAVPGDVPDFGVPCRYPGS